MCKPNRLFRMASLVLYSSFHWPKQHYMGVCHFEIPSVVFLQLSLPPGVHWKRNISPKYRKEISRWPLFRLSDRYVTFISISFHSVRIYSIAYSSCRKWENATLLLFACIYDMWYSVYLLGRIPPLLTLSACIARPRASSDPPFIFPSARGEGWCRHTVSGIVLPGVVSGFLSLSPEAHMEGNQCRTNKH
jgi:hypothetical protein